MSGSSPKRRYWQRGMTLVELIVAFTILSLLTGMAVPLARTRVRREKEKELRIALREIHAAIDKYKDMADAGQLGQQKAGNEGYPESLEVLVEGVNAQGANAFGANNTTSSSSSSSKGADAEKKIRFLRRIPKDPFTGTTDWGKRSTQDDPKSTAWGGQNVFSVYSKTMEKAADGTPYSEW